MSRSAWTPASIRSASARTLQAADRGRARRAPRARVRPRRDRRRDRRSDGHAVRGDTRISGAHGRGPCGPLCERTPRRTPRARQQGRYHVYEGHPRSVVALPVRTARALGVSTMIVTNAAGGIRQRPRARAPSCCWKTTSTCRAYTPLVGPVFPGESRFPDMSSAYDPTLMELARSRRPRTLDSADPWRLRGRRRAVVRNARPRSGCSSGWAPTWWECRRCPR